MPEPTVEIPDGPPGPMARGGYVALRALARFLGRVYVRLEVVGAERVPTTGGFVLAPIHRSNLDFLLAALGSPRRVRWMAKDSIFLGGWIDRFLVSMGAFPVDRARADRTALARAESLLGAGEPVVMFPEGRRREGARVQEMHRGPAFVAARRRVPVVPMGIGGSDRAMPIGSKVIYPHRIVLVVGEPLYPDVPLEGRVPRPAVDDLTERLRDAVQDCYDRAKALAGA